MQKIKLLFSCSLSLLILGIAVHLALEERHSDTFSTVLFWLSVASAFACNVYMSKLKMVGKSSPYIFVIASITVIGFFPMLALMGYAIRKENDSIQA